MLLYSQRAHNDVVLNDVAPNAHWAFPYFYEIGSFYRKIYWTFLQFIWRLPVYLSHTLPITTVNSNPTPSLSLSLSPSLSLSLQVFTDKVHFK